MTEHSAQAPLILIVDDLFGRSPNGGRNEERDNLCGQFLLQDVTGDQPPGGLRIKRPLARVVFSRGQQPACSRVGDVVRNDEAGVLELVGSRWQDLAPGQERWALVLLDLCFYTGEVTAASTQRAAGVPEGRPGDDDPERYFGLQLLRSLQSRFPDLPVAILSSKPREEVSRAFSTSGAVDFLSRADLAAPRRLRELLFEHGLVPDSEGTIIGRSLPVLQALRAARRVASSRRNVLLRGERGTGKEQLARYLHRQGGGDELGPFIEVNSSVLTPELFASELFGVEAGAATNVAARPGLIAQAAGGLLFLDEIGDMLPQVQAGILRVLQERRFTRVGGSATVSADVRFVSATNKPVEALAAAGDYREDLLDRLCEGGSIHLPPLRERKEDIPVLVDAFVRAAEARLGDVPRRTIEPEAIDKLLGHDWPGNVRELRDRVVAAVENYRNVEHLVPVQLELPTAPAPTPKATVPPVTPSVTPPATPAPVATPAPTVGRSVRAEPDESLGVEALLQAMASCAFDVREPAELAGQLPKLQAAWGRLLMRYLAASLRVTSRPTPEEPSGKLLIHPAIKLMTGDQRLTASRAADLIKRMVRESSLAEEELLADSVVAEAHDIALRLRPRGTGKKR